MFNEVKYFSNDTIYALSTPAGGAIAVTRVSGPLVPFIYEKLTINKKREHRVAKNIKIVSQNGETIDDALLIFFESPKSFTGEDLLEIHSHGSPAVIENIHKALSFYGARQAIAGEFSFRSVKSGKQTILQAQAVSELIAAQNNDAASIALDKMAGYQNKIIEEISYNLKNLVARSELGIDFSDQDVEELSLPVLKKHTDVVIDKLKMLADSFNRGEKIQEGFKTAFIGLPNAGKSSFFNAILGEESAIVSEVPGTTRDIIHEKITLRGRLNEEEKQITLRIEDTAGIRKTNDKIEQLGIQKSLKSIHQSDLIIWVIDISSLILQQEELMRLHTEIKNALDKVVVVFNKIDQATAQSEQLKQEFLVKIGLQPKRASDVSSKSGEGIESFIQILLQQMAHMTHRTPGEVIITKKSQFESIQKAVRYLEQALQANEEDLFAADIRHALHEIGQIIGQTLPDDILAQIFSEFCIGK